MTDGHNHLVFFGSRRVQTINKGRELWFLVSDLGRMLELTQIRKNLYQLKDDEKDLCYMHLDGGWVEAPKGKDDSGKEGSDTKLVYRPAQRRRVSVVNEAGLYRLIIMSRTPEAGMFKDWLVREVLPAIRKTGKYKHRKTTPLAFMPKGISVNDTLGITAREQMQGHPYNPLSWIGPCEDGAQELPEPQSEIDAAVE
jgi:prophage antirepressor-like protein